MEEIRNDVLTEELEQLLEKKDYRRIKQLLNELYPQDIAELFDDFDAGDCVIMFRLMHKDLAAEVFSYLEGDRRKALASSIDARLLEYVLDSLYFDDKIDFLEEMPANFVKTLLQNSPAEERTLINQFLQYPENSAGSLMTIEYVDLKKSMTVAEAFSRIKSDGVDKETIYTCYVLDETRKLEGIISLRRLVLADGDKLIGDIMNTDVVSVEAYDDQEDIAELFKKYDFMAVPVVDAEKRLIGIITIDDIIDVIERENTEDFQKMAAMAPNEEPYLETGVFKLSRHRIVWLLVLMVSATLTGGIITRYEELLSSAVLLTAFIPMLMDSGGNAGSQSSTLIIRGIALGEIELRDWPKVLWKELRVSIIVGLGLAIVNAGRMLLISRATLDVTITVSLTLFATIIIAKIIGGLLPIAAKAVRLDPAIMASPLITTIVDACSLVIFFGIASAIVL